MRKTLRRIRRVYHNGYVVIIATAIIMFWWGMFGLLDTFLLPQHEFLSHAGALVIGLFILFVNDFRLDELE